MATKIEICQEILDERARQDLQWGGAEHDDQHHVETWTDLINTQLLNADECGETDQAGSRERFIKIAALAVAAIESLDRRTVPSVKG